MREKETMGVFPLLMAQEHESVAFFSDGAANLKAIIAIHSTRLGPALGGVRMRPYETEEAALLDALRLSRGMTYKAAVTGLNLGGGKAVIIGNPTRDKSEALFRSFGRAVESLGGRYITAEDVGTEVQDMAQIRLETSHVVGTSEEAGGSGDPSPVTALGVLAGIKTCVDVVFGSPDLKGCRVAIQGVGKVGYRLAELLHRQGVEPFLCDVVSERAAAAAMAFHGHEVKEQDFFALPLDVLSPCALGGILNDEAIPRIRARIIAGAANNQLQDELRHSQALSSRGILYAPDFVINAGGLINVYSEIEKTPKGLALQRTEAIGETLRRVLTMAQVEGISTYETACRLAEERLAAAEAREAAR